MGSTCNVPFNLNSAHKEGSYLSTIERLSNWCLRLPSLNVILCFWKFQDRIFFPHIKVYIGVSL